MGIDKIKVVCFSILVLVFLVSIYADHTDILTTRIEVSGAQSGVWESGNFYEVTDDIIVEEADTLIIEPGVRVEFNSLLSFTIYGILIAEGTEADSIIFSSWSALPTSNDWGGIYFSGVSSSGSHISYSVIEWCMEGISCEDESSPVLEHNYIHDTNYGIQIDEGSFTVIQNNKFCNNIESIYCNSSSLPVIMYNKIYNAEIGIRSMSNLEIVISYNLFLNCEIGIHYNMNSNTTYNNTFANNETGIRAGQAGDLYVKNSIFYGNEHGLSQGDYTTIISEYNEFYLNVQDFGGAPVPFGEIVAFNNNGYPCDIFYNIFGDPGFNDPEALDFNLQGTSICIDAGDPDSLYIDPDNTIADLGCFYYQQYDPPIYAEFQAYPRSGSAPLTVDFTNISTGAINYCIWNFGDGDTSTTYSPEHQYQEPGLYTVSLTAYGTNQQNTEIKPDYIDVGIPVEYIYGSQCGVWTSDHLYRVTGEINIVSGNTLIIEPGVTVEFMGYYSINVWGTFSANGNIDAPVNFKSGNETGSAGDWIGIRFEGINSSESQLSYCIITDAYVGITCDNQASPSIHHNSIYDNCSGIICHQNSSPDIFNNTLVNNSYYGVYCETGEPVLVNNIFTGSISAISSGVMLPNFNYNLFWQNDEDYSGIIPADFAELNFNNYNGDPCDCYYNIFLDPLFADFEGQDFNLIDDSPAIDAGNPEAAYEDLDGTISDMGARYFHQVGASPNIGELKTSYLIGNYPNPFNPETKISFYLSSEADVEISVYNVAGQKIRQLIKKHYLAGDNAVSWNGKDQSGKEVSSGLYIYTLKLNRELRSVKRCLLIK